MRTDSSSEIRQRRDSLFAAFSHESNRGIVLVAAAFLDHVLEALLRARFTSHSPKPAGVVDPLFEGFGPLASFAAKIKLCFVIDLIQEWVFKDLEIIRKLRNKVGHTTDPVAFDDPAIMAFTKRLSGADHAVEAITEQGHTKPERRGHGTIKRGPRKTVDIATMERIRFAMTVSYVGALLVSKIVVQQCKVDERFKTWFMIHPKM